MYTKVVVDMERVKLLESDKAVRFVIDQVMFRVISRRERSHAGLDLHSQTTDKQPHSLTLCSWVDSNMNANAGDRFGGCRNISLRC